MDKEPMSRYLLDTTFVIDHLRGRPEAVSRLRRLVELGDVAFVNDVVCAEAWTGAPGDDDPALTTLLQFLEFIAAGPDHARTAGRWRARSKASGHDIGVADALIAACADANQAAVLTRNVDDFSRTPVPVETY
ncbi:MAG TPA: PIN domain-containing protein [Candidatus Limnocylindrales bacterium]